MSYGFKRSQQIFKYRSSLLEGIVVYYELDEQSGPALDEVANNHATANGSPGTDAGLWTSARTFTAAGGANFTVASAPRLQAGTNSKITVCAWSYHTTTTQGGRVCRWGGSTSEFALWCDSAGQHAFNNNANGAAGAAVNTNIWEFSVGWDDGVSNSLNVQTNNGSITTLTAAEAAAGNSSLCIGAVANGDRSMDGRLNMVGYWKRILTAQERAMLYNGGRGLRYPFNPQ